MRLMSPVLTLAFLACLHGESLGLDPGITAIMSVTPEDQTRYLACEIVLSPGQALASLHWYNNDETASFPNLVLMESTVGSPPLESSTRSRVISSFLKK